MSTIEIKRYDKDTSLKFSYLQNTSRSWVQSEPSLHPFHSARIYGNFVSHNFYPSWDLLMFANPNIGKNIFVLFFFLFDWNLRRNSSGKWKKKGLNWKKERKKEIESNEMLWYHRIFFSEKKHEYINEEKDPKARLWDGLEMLFKGFEKLSDFEKTCEWVWTLAKG